MFQIEDKGNFEKDINSDLKLILQAYISSTKMACTEGDFIKEITHNGCTFEIFLKSLLYIFFDCFTTCHLL